MFMYEKQAEREKQKRKNDETRKLIIRRGVFLLVSIVGVGLLLAGAIVMFGTNVHVNIIHNTDTPLLPVELQATPDSFWVGSMTQGMEGWVGWGSIYVDRDSRMWISPEWAVTTRYIYNEQVRIRREGDYIVLYRSSVGSHRWTPGVDPGWNVKGKDNLIPVILR